ncbi:MAG: universal stress protein [Halobacteriaceae archaeon]
MTQQILVPLDASPQSWDAFEYALEEYPEATITALHVISPTDSLLRGDVFGGETKRSVQTAENILTQAQDIATAFQAEVSTVTEQGKPADVIVTYAEENDIDHIVIGSHGRSGVSRILLGSVAEKVVRRSPVPVTIIR